MRDKKTGRFVEGPSHLRLSIGAIRVRTRHGRSGVQRQFIKIAQPDKWILYAHYLWEESNGPIPPKMGVHHKDGNTLNDHLSNLELLSKKEHLARHRPEFRHKQIASLVKMRRKLRWSTRNPSRTSWTNEQMLAAIAEYRAGSVTKSGTARKYDIPLTTFSQYLSGKFNADNLIIASGLPKE